MHAAPHNINNVKIIGSISDAIEMPCVNNIQLNNVYGKPLGEVIGQIGISILHKYIQIGIPVLL